MQRFTSSDVVLDFNGDIFPSDTGVIRVINHVLEIMTVRQLGVPVVEFVSSPGPFRNWIRRALSRLMFSRINIFLNIRAFKK